MKKELAQVEASLEEAILLQHCEQLRLPSVGAQFSRLAEQAAKHNHPTSIIRICCWG